MTMPLNFSVAENEGKGDGRRQATVMAMGTPKSRRRLKPIGDGVAVAIASDAAQSHTEVRGQAYCWGSFADVWARVLAILRKIIID